MRIQKSMEGTFIGYNAFYMLTNILKTILECMELNFRVVIIDVLYCSCTLTVPFLLEVMTRETVLIGFTENFKMSVACKAGMLIFPDHLLSPLVVNGFVKFFLFISLCCLVDSTFIFVCSFVYFYFSLSDLSTSCCFL